MRVVVTGGAGFIGANLVRRLLEDNEPAEVVVLDDYSTGRRSNLEGLDVRIIEGSILDPDALDEAVAGADSIVHLAARASVPRSLADPVATAEVNVMGTIQVLEAARRHDVGHLIVASSSSVYGSNPTLPKHEDLAPRPMSPYAASKLGTESFALAYAASFGLKVLAFRFFNVYGPLQPADHAYAAVIPRFIDAALKGEPLIIYGDGKQTRDFTYVGSVCELLADAVASGYQSDEPVNLAFGGRVSLLELVSELERILEASTLRVEHLPPRAGDVRDSQADSRALRSLAENCEPLPLAAGLVQTVRWFRDGFGEVGSRGASREPRH